MNAKQLIRLLLVLYTGACGNVSPNIAAQDSFPVGKVIDTVTCKADPTQSYALYIPARGDKEVLPIVYLFDPHASGVLPLSRYRALADTYGFILVGSNNSKNGNDWVMAENIWHRLYEDTRTRLKVNNDRIYTCGFSGGAKVASYMALRSVVIKGVIANGAGLPDGTPASDLNFSFTAIAGEGDMNMTDLVAISKNLDHTRTRHRIIIFDGKHEWAPENSMDMAFAGWQFDAMLEGLIPKDEGAIAQYIAKSKQRLDADYHSNQLIKAARECALTISLIDGLSSEVSWFKEKATSLAGNPAYQKQRQEQEALLTREQATKAEYMQHFQQGDMQYWTTTIRALQAKAGMKNGESGMNQRLLAYLSLAFYSISNQLINAGNNDAARHFVELYKMADPDNSEAWYFSAILNARAGQQQAAEADLKKAVSCGFKDSNRMRQQPEFQNLTVPKQ